MQLCTNLSGKDNIAELLRQVMMIGVPYIFIIGFNKTGTLSLHKFFLRNGFPSVHWHQGKLALKMLDNLVSERKILSGYDTSFRVFSDMMILNNSIDFQANKYFKILDRDYPDSYFIYNYRDIDKWIESRKNHMGKVHSFFDRSMNANNSSDFPDLEYTWKLERTRFEEDIRRYFADNDRYIELDIERDDVCARISKLIGMELIAEHWKHEGKTRKQ